MGQGGGCWLQHLFPLPALQTVLPAGSLRICDSMREKGEVDRFLQYLCCVTVASACQASQFRGVFSMGGVFKGDEKLSLLVFFASQCASPLRLGSCFLSLVPSLPKKIKCRGENDAVKSEFNQNRAGRDLGDLLFQPQETRYHFRQVALRSLIKNLQ